MIKKIILLGLVIWGIGVFALADTVSRQDKFIYRFHLYYDNGQLLANRDFKFKYDIVSDNFIPEVISIANPFRGEVVSVINEVLYSFQFDPQKGNLAFKKGGVAVDAPYFADAAKVNFYDDKNLLLLALDVSGSSFCNDDGTCNSDVGENYQNCPNDCPKPATPTPVPSVTPSAGISSLKLILIFAGAAVLIVVIWVVWAIIRKRKSGGGTLPPEVPIEVPPVPPISQ